MTTVYLYKELILTVLRNIQQHRYYLTFLSLLSSIFFWLSWPPNRFVFLLFVAFCPLLLIERHVEAYEYKRPYWTFYKYTYLTLFLWNLTTTWWVAYATVAGAIVMLFVNTFCMSLPLLLFQFTVKQLGQFIGYLSLITYWVSMEHIHLQWELSFPWLNLGNGFACFPEWVQWYEYTGALGGTVWILVTNLLLCYLITSKNPTKQRQIIGLVGCWVIFPILGSYYRYVTYKDQGEAVEVAVMQPNINPNTGAFVDTGEVPPMQERVERFIELSETQLTSKTRFLVWPEIAIDSLFDEQILGEYPLIDQLVGFRKLYPQLSVVTGLNTLVGYRNEQATKTARFSHRHGYYDIFNTALFVGNQGTLAIYHKSKLVPGVEIVPYIYSLEIPKFLTPDDLGGKLNSLGMQDRPSVFFDREGMGVAPVICYESVYGDYLTEFVRRGASLIFSITIDGWWKKTPGYQQHCHYTRLRAIESRRSIARSALKGISAFINQRGDILQASNYDDQAVMKHSLKANSTLTFYVQHNDYIPRSALWVSLFLVIGAMLSNIFTKRAYTLSNIKDKYGNR